MEASEPHRNTNQKQILPEHTQSELPIASSQTRPGPISHSIQHPAQVLQHLDGVTELLTGQFHVHKTVSRNGLLASTLFPQVHPVPVQLHIALCTPL